MFIGMENNLMTCLFFGQTMHQTCIHKKVLDTALRTSINIYIVGGVQLMMDFISGMYGPTDDTRLEAQAASIPISFHMIIPNFTADGFSLRQTAAAKCQSTDENAPRWWWWWGRFKGEGWEASPLTPLHHRCLGYAPPWVWAAAGWWGMKGAAVDEAVGPAVRVHVDTSVTGPNPSPPQ